MIFIETHVKYKTLNILLLLLKRIYKAFFLKKRDEWKVVAICVGVATTIWVLQALNKKYTTRLRLPISIEYDSLALVPLAKVPRYIDINATGYGWNLLKRSFNISDGKPLKLLVDVGTPPYMFGEQLLPLISETVSDVKVEFVITDTLKLYFEPIVTREIPLILDTTHLHTDTCAFIKKVVFSPRKVKIQGAQSFVNDFPSKLAITVRDTNLVSDINEVLPVRLPQKMTHITLQPSQVLVNVTLGRKPC